MDPMTALTACYLRVGHERGEIKPEKIKFGTRDGNFRAALLLFL